MDRKVVGMMPTMADMKAVWGTVTPSKHTHTGELPDLLQPVVTWVLLVTHDSYHMTAQSLDHCPAGLSSDPAAQVNFQLWCLSMASSRSAKLPNSLIACTNASCSPSSCAGEQLSRWSMFALISSLRHSTTVAPVVSWAFVQDALGNKLI